MAGYKDELLISTCSNVKTTADTFGITGELFELGKPCGLGCKLLIRGIVKVLGEVCCHIIEPIRLPSASMAHLHPHLLTWGYLREFYLKEQDAVAVDPVERAGL
jgi:hypothetical protein